MKWWVVATCAFSISNVDPSGRASSRDTELRAPATAAITAEATTTAAIHAATSLADAPAAKWRATWVESEIVGATPAVDDAATMHPETRLAGAAWTLCSSIAAAKAPHETATPRR